MYTRVQSKDFRNAQLGLEQNNNSSNRDDILIMSPVSIGDGNKGTWSFIR